MKRSLATTTAALFAAGLFLSPAPAHARVDDGTLEVLGYVGGSLAVGALLLAGSGVMKLVDRAKRRRARELDLARSGAYVPGPAVVPAEVPSGAGRPDAESPPTAAPPPASAPTPATSPASSWVRRALSGPASKPAAPPAPPSSAPAPR